jgi:endonuclease/exonuclease/phosphatase family metal-dependent hydrolase
MALLPNTLGQADQSAGGGCVIVTGDFNATLDMRPFRDLLRNGYRDAAEQAGAGFVPTFFGGWLPALFAIDHVITLRCTAVDVRSSSSADQTTEHWPRR